jgi:hypothetical protein
MTKVVISSGMRLIRARFGLSPYECPDPVPEDLSSYLSFLQNSGTQRPLVKFPRTVGRRDEEGLCQPKRLGRTERWEFALSVASLKRSLPNDCAAHSASVLEAWAASRFSPPPPPPLSYYHFARMIAEEIFPHGWDSTYQRQVGSFMPNASSRGREFPRGDLAWMGQEERFFRAVLDGVGLPDDLVVELSEVPTPGKKRAITIPSPDADILGPLHRTLYDALRRTDWCLVGPPTAERISSVCSEQWHTSVDLVNATDGLNLSITECFLEVARKNSEHVPPEVFDFAKISLHATVGGRTIWHGQMMGIYLSFPFLCCHSYTAARWAARNDKTAKFLVNGDDTAISGPRPYLASDYPSGYQLNDNKTVRSQTVVEVNSTVFLKKGVKFREVRNLRRGGFDPSTYHGMLHAADSCLKAGTKWVDGFVRSRIGKGWGFLPSQLGLTQTRSFPAWRYDRQMRDSLRRFVTPLPELASPVSDLLEVRRGKPSPDEVAALVSHQWQYGREKKKREEVFSPRKGEVFKTYGFARGHINMLAKRRGFSFLGKQSFPQHIASLTSREKVNVYFVPKGYTSISEEKEEYEQRLRYEAFVQAWDEGYIAVSDN